MISWKVRLSLARKLPGDTDSVSIRQGSRRDHERPCAGSRARGRKLPITLDAGRVVKTALNDVRVDGEGIARVVGEGHRQTRVGNTRPASRYLNVAAGIVSADQ